MAAMGARHHLEDGAGFAMPAGAENDSLVAPFHALSFSPVARRNQGHERPPADWRLSGSLGTCIGCVANGSDAPSSQSLRYASPLSESDSPASKPEVAATLKGASDNFS